MRLAEATHELGGPLAEGRSAIDAAYARFVRPLVPPGQPLWDAHTHLGRDADGARLETGALLAEMSDYGVTRAFVVPFAAPDPGAYRDLNDRIIEECSGSAGALVPFCRARPGEGFAAELERALDRGARGIKLHPTNGAFDLSHPDLRVAFALADERGVPLLLHAGRGLVPLAGDLAPLLAQFRAAQVILAHAAIADMEHVLELAGDHPNLSFDSSVWNALDLHALLAGAAPEQILYGTDAPYYVAPCAQAKLLLALAAAGAGTAEVAQVVWENAARVAAGRSAKRLSAPLGRPRLDVPYGRLRAHEYLLMAVPLVWRRQPDLVGFVRLAVQSLAGADRPALEEACHLLELAERCWAEELQTGAPDEILSLSWLTFRLVELADALILGEA